MTSKIDLWQGDCLELMKRIPDGSVDFVCADIPYGTTNCRWDQVIPFEPMWAELKRIIKPNGAICLFGTEPFSSHLRLSNLKWFKYDWVWNKTIGGNPFNNKYKPATICENISVFGKGKINYFPIMEPADPKNIRPHIKVKKKTNLLGVFKNGFIHKCDKNLIYPKNLITYSSRNAECNQTKRVHPTQKPVALLEYLIKTYTLENETVLDFTAGSFSTGVAAVNLNRSFIGIEFIASMLPTMIPASKSAVKSR